ncbi:unnamed protein product [Arabis nemorensis]|uniref:Uncharacterized protein n=1 Tax=Arabis nemorensis TaxID=586526 RepID=A0A565BGY8_9BRAS|nr:unnamed protein product [Arabis nemorensis]
MELQTICLGFLSPRFRFSSRDSLAQLHGSSTFATRQQIDSRQTLLWNKPQDANYLTRGRVLCSSSRSVPNPEIKQSEKSNNYARAEQFRGKSGSVSFNGLTHQLVEESKLVSAPFQEEKDSFLWILAPVVLISSLILPQFFLSGAIEATFKNDTVAEIVTSFCFETTFYAGLAIFLSVTDRVQRPYLDFSSKRWGLITGLRGYLMSAFLMMGLKVVVPLFAVYMTWPALGLDALIAVLPFLVGCAVQRLFESRLERRGSSCWPIVPIVFEVYRVYQITRAATFVQRLMFMMKDASTTVEITERGVALVGLVVTLQFLAVLCLWSFITFIMRLFPSRPVAENY